MNKPGQIETHGIRVGDRVEVFYPHGFTREGWATVHQIIRRDTLWGIRYVECRVVFDGEKEAVIRTVRERP